MIDLANYIIIRRTYENFKAELSGCNNVKELKPKVQKFLSFLSSIDVEASLKEFVNKQKEIAKKLLLVINIRYLIVFLYKYLVHRLLIELLYLINNTLKVLGSR